MFIFESIKNKKFYSNQKKYNKKYTKLKKIEKIK